MTATRKLFVMRHAERVDFTFGSEWILTSFENKDKYMQTNINMPLSVPKRIGGPWDFVKDSPLTRIGLYQATLTGEAMKSAGVKFDHVFCSPSLRCIETCTNVLKASDQTHLIINIEPGLFEWLSWYIDSMPKWMTVQEMKEAGFNVSLDYEPVNSVASMQNLKETSEQYYDRNFRISKMVVEKYPGNILLVAHASSLDTCTRQLVGQPARNEGDLCVMVPKVTYASVALAEETANNQWRLAEPPFPPFAHTNNAGFDWRTLLV